MDFGDHSVIHKKPVSKNPKGTTTSPNKQAPLGRIKYEWPLNRSLVVWPNVTIVTESVIVLQIPHTGQLLGQLTEKEPAQLLKRGEIHQIIGLLFLQTSKLSLISFLVSQSSLINVLFSSKKRCVTGHWLAIQ